MIKIYISLAVSIFSIGAAQADEKQTLHPDVKTEVCQRIETPIRLALGDKIRGDFSTRVLVALDAHERLGCPPESLLPLLGIKMPAQKRQKRP